MQTMPIELVEAERAKIDESIRERTSARRRVQDQIDVLTGQRDGLDDALQADVNALEAYDAFLDRVRADEPPALTNPLPPPAPLPPPDAQTRAAIDRLAQDQLGDGVDDFGIGQEIEE